MTSVLHALTPSGGGPRGLVRGQGAGGSSERLTAEGSLRTSKMYEEADDFARRMGEFERGLTTFQRATADFIESLLPMMSAPLPRVWDQLPDGGLAEPLRARLSHAYPSEMLGADADINGIRAAVLDTERRLATGISRPLAQWREALDTARQRLPEVHRLRRELLREQSSLDKTTARAERRHRRDVGLDEPHGVSGLLFRCTHPRSASPVGRGRVAAADAGDVGAGAGGAATDSEADARTASPGGRGRGVGERSSGPGAVRPFREEFRAEERNMKTVYRARRHEAILKSFVEQEGLLNEQLSGLCRDASWLKSYMIASLVASKEGLQSTVYHLGSTKQPVPGHAEGLPAGLRGGVGRNDHLVREVPKFLADRTSRMQALERLRGRMGREGLHAHRAVASPMELHARGDVSGREKVPPARRGAADTPLGGGTEAAGFTGAAGASGAGTGTGMAPLGMSAAGSFAAAPAPAGADMGRTPALGGTGVGGTTTAAQGGLGGVAPGKLAVIGDTVVPVPMAGPVTVG
ncbi:hypothetical protein HYH03_006679 [Edaphochlamys debaryana]|uniref:Uncharacterized protein n=1 Tax=Edaphochlamys debaryana TaxID=47281 RepID=A0A835Y5F7_9CHLO|nr:hypothetical protein HYH03_006679 [Edaphochlamys debaryana]|eukprot:KAG2495068.1 hypothetical protein HYH03_006679 [Edaphochlamys debaryana]